MTAYDHLKAAAGTIAILVIAYCIIRITWLTWFGK